MSVGTDGKDLHHYTRNNGITYGSCS